MCKPRQSGFSGCTGVQIGKKRGKFYKVLTEAACASQQQRRWPRLRRRPCAAAPLGWPSGPSRGARAARRRSTSSHFNLCRPKPSSLFFLVQALPLRLLAQCTRLYLRIYTRGRVYVWIRTYARGKRTPWVLVRL